MSDQNEPKQGGALPSVPLEPIVLHLVLSFDWFHQILAGNKTVEYRRICPNWSRLIWSRRDQIKTVVFHKGYTDTTIAGDVDSIDIGECPYAGWNGNYYRIHFRMQNTTVQATATKEEKR